MIVSDRFSASWSRVAFVMAAAAFVGVAIGAGSARAGEPPSREPGASSVQRLRPGNPRDHGLTDAGLDALRAILRQAVEDRVVPGVSLLLAHRGEVIFKEAFGDLRVDQKAQMASSSKPVTATLLMIL